MKKLSILIDSLDIIKIIGNVDICIENVCYDSRKVIKGSLFVAMRGVVTDGHNFIQSAIDQSASAIICEKLPAELNNDITYIQVANTRIALSQISNIWFDEPTADMNIIGITGTNGKTTITYLLQSIFEQCNIKSAIIGTTGAYFGNRQIELQHTTPESFELFEIFNEIKSEGIKYVFMEVSSHALAQNRVDSIYFSGAVFTNLTHDHLDYHKNMQEYATAKKILFDKLNSSAIAIINGDSEYSDYLVSDCSAKHIFRIGFNNQNSEQISIDNEDLFGSKFVINDKQNDVNYELSTSLVGSFNIFNSAMAFLTAIKSGINPESAQLALKSAKGAPGRMQKVELPNKALGVVDYAHTPDALEKALKALEPICRSAGSRLICVFGCGGDRDKTKRPIMGKISTSIADITVITSDNPRTEAPDLIIQDILSGCTDLSNVHSQVNRAEAIEYAYSLTREGDIVLVAGKGHETYQIIGTVKIHFDDYDELKKLK